MANTKKYVSLDKLSLYDEKIKKLINDADAAGLQSAKDYADSLAGNYEAAGSVASAQTALQANIDAVETKANTAQNEVDALETYVGTIPTTATATNIVAYVQEKTSGIATDTALQELTGRVAQAETDIDNIEKDYLKAADKTELSDAITAEENRATGIEGGLRTDVDAIKADYLKAADKTELQGNIDAVAEDVADIVADYLKAADKTELEGKIDAKVAQADYDAKMVELDGDIDDLQGQINTIMNNPDTENVINSITEFTQYIADHGEIADGFRTDINKNKDDIAAMDTAYKAADTAIKGRLDVLEAIDHEAYVAADTALKNELNGEIAKKADKTALETAVQTLEGADTGLGNRITALENKFGEGEGSVEDLIADAKQEAIDTAAGDATSKANAAEAAAKGHADSLNTAMNTRVEALEAIDHDHSNKAELDLIASGDKAKWDEAYTKRHEHSNLTVLEGITAAKVTAWDAAEGNAKTYADGLNTAMDTRVKAIEDWHANFVEVSEEEINDLFKA